MEEGFSLFSKSGVLGLMVAIPVGPVTLLILQRSLKVGSLTGIASGVGAALADGLFGLLAAIGLMTLVGGLEQTRHFVRPLGSLVLMIVGIYFFFQKPPSLEADEVLAERYRPNYLWDMLSAHFLTLLNPTTLIAFAALFAGSDLIPEDPRKIQYFEITTGVFSGSLLWWLLLGALAKPIKKWLSPLMVHRILQVTGILLLVLALISFVPRFGSVMEKIKLTFFLFY